MECSPQQTDEKPWQELWDVRKERKEQWKQLRREEAHSEPGRTRITSVGEMASDCIHILPSNFFSDIVEVWPIARGVRFPPMPAGREDSSIELLLSASLMPESPSA